MTVKQYLTFMCGQYDNVTFIKARARKDAHAPMYHAEYQTTPINTAAVWNDSGITDYIILNDKQSPIEWLSGACWGNAINRGALKCLLIISPTDFELLTPNAEQRDSIVKYIDEKITK